MMCKICRESDARVIGKPRFNKKFPRIMQKDYRIFQCNTCKFYFLHPDIDLSQKEWSLLYREDYFLQANVSKWQKKLHYRERKYRVDLIKKHSCIKIDKFLDLGCGEGFVLTEVIKQGFKPYGLDIADNFNSTVNKDQIHFFHGNIFEADYPEKFFSAIYMDSVLEHVSDPLCVLKELKRILKPKGILLLIVPNEDNLTNAFKKLVYWITHKQEKYGKIKSFVPPYHIQGFNKKSLRMAIMKSGFKIETLSEFGGSYTFWKAYKILSKPHIREILLYPIGLLSIPLKRENQLMAIVTKYSG